MTAPVADLKMRASKIAAVDPTLHVRINGCADESLNACRASHSCIEQIENVASSRWWRTDLERLPLSSLNLTALHGGLNKALGDANMEGTSASVEYQQKLYVALASLPYVENICEIGFNGGHSAQLWLAANPRARVFMFDKRSHPDANERALKWLHSRPELSAAKRLELISGWSHLEVRKFAKERPTIKCDLLSIDGSHTMFGASNDLKNAHLIVRPCCHLALLDDTNWVRTEASNANGTALTSWPMQALRKAEADNLTCSLFNLDEVPGRGVTVMRVNT